MIGPLLGLLHPLPSLATVGAALLFGILLGLHGPALAGMLVVLLLAQFSISALNDWADRGPDARAGRHRALPLQLIRPAAVVFTAAAFGAAAVGLAFLEGDRPAANLVLVGGLLTGWAYDLWLKPTPASIVPFALAFPLLLIWISVLAGTGPSPALIFGGGAPLAGAIHLADSIPDREADRRAGSRTLAVALGSPGAERAAAFLLLAGSGVLLLAVAGRHLLPAAAVGAVALLAGIAYLAGRRTRWLIPVAALSVVSAWLYQS